MEKPSEAKKKRVARRQSDAMTHAIDAHERGDRQGFEGAAKEVVRAGTELGFRSEESSGDALFPGKPRRRQKIEPKHYRNSTNKKTFVM